MDISKISGSTNNSDNQIQVILRKAENCSKLNFWDKLMFDQSKLFDSINYYKEAISLLRQNGSQDSQKQIVEIYDKVIQLDKKTDGFEEKILYKERLEVARLIKHNHEQIYNLTLADVELNKKQGNFAGSAQSFAKMADQLRTELEFLKDDPEFENVVYLTIKGQEEAFRQFKSVDNQKHDSFKYHELAADLVIIQSIQYANLIKSKQVSDYLNIDNGIKLMSELIDNSNQERYLKFSLCRLFTKNLIGFLLNDDAIGMNKRLNQLVVIDPSFCDEADQKFIAALYEEQRTENWIEVISLCAQQAISKRMDETGVALLNLLIEQKNNLTNGNNKKSSGNANQDEAEDEDDVL